MSTPWSWKQSLYAFLLRRALSPYLTKRSAAELHRSIQDVDWSDGRFVLVNVDLDPSYLTSIIRGEKKHGADFSQEGEEGVADNAETAQVSSSRAPNVAVQHARIKRLAIHLSLKEIDSIDNNGESTSTARKAASAVLRSVFGSNDSVEDGSGVGGMALEVHVQLDGLDVVFCAGGNKTNGVSSIRKAPNQGHPAHVHSQTAAVEESPLSQEQDVNAPGFFSSLIDSAMKSLRLSINLSNVKIRAYSHEFSVGGKETLEVHTNHSENMTTSTSDCWVELRLASARYYDLIESKNNKDRLNTAGFSGPLTDRTWTMVQHGERSQKINKSAEKMVVSKALDWEGMVIETGPSNFMMHCPHESNKTDAWAFLPFPILKSTGLGTIRFRAFEKLSMADFNDFHPESSTLRQDVEISMGQNIDVRFDLRSVRYLVSVATALTTEEKLPTPTSFGENGNDVAILTGDNEIYHPQNDNQKNLASLTLKPMTVNDSHLETYEQLMKQYAEARHLARTRELRGGLLIPCIEESDNTDVDDGDISFDAFFDANEHSASYYCSYLDGKEENVDENCQGKDGKSSRHSIDLTKVLLQVAEVTVKIYLGDTQVTERMGNTTLSMMESLEESSEFVLFSLGDLSVVSFGSNGSSSFNCSISHFEIESQLLEFPTSKSGLCSTAQTSILRFTSDTANGFNSGGDDFIVSSPPCISALVEVFDENHSEAKDNRCKVDVMLQPFEIIYQNYAISRLLDVVKILNLPTTQTQTPDKVQDSNIGSLHFAASCSLIVLVVPCQRISKHPSRGSKQGISNPLFQRCSYIDHESRSSQFLGLGLELDNVAMEFSKGISDIESTCSDIEETKSLIKCSHAVFFAKSTELGQGRRNRKFASYVSRRTDLMAFTGDESRKSDALVKISYSQIVLPNKDQHHEVAKRKSVFPIVLPLSSTKARQESDDSDKIEGFYGDVLRSPDASDRVDANDVQSSDPQYILSSEASKAGKELTVYIPCIFFDFTTCERRELTRILSSFIPEGSNQEAKIENDKIDIQSDESCAESDESLLSVSVCIDQMSLTLHGSHTNNTSVDQLKHDSVNSYSFIFDKMLIHALITPNGLRNIRALSHDVTLYESSIQRCFNSIDVGNQYPTSCADRCKLILDRFTRNPLTLTRAIFYRTKLCQPLSPETPAFLVDVLLRKTLTEEDGDERSIYISVYDMTYRYNMNSQWLKGVIDLLKDNGVDEGVHQQHEPSCKNDGNEELSSLTNLFVNLTDCNIDYTPPVDFNTGSRIFLRIGEVRLTSNLVTPSAMVQAYKLSLCDVCLNVCNHRHPYNEENLLLSCAHRHFHTDDLYVPDNLKRLSNRNVVAMDDVLCKMNFITFAILDTLDAILLSSNRDIKQGKSFYRKDPATTIALSLGRLSLYACQDSFSCLNSTYNEWFIKFTALSAEELDSLRVESETRSNVSTGKDINAAKNESLLSFAQDNEKKWHNPSITPTTLESPEQGKSPDIYVKTPQSQPIITPNSSLQQRGCTKQSDTCSNFSNKSKQREQDRDDLVSLDLTKSLLIRNYYTFDAKNHHPVPKPLQTASDPVSRRKGKEVISQLLCEDDDWTAVEHDFLRHSKIPREQDQTTQWLFDGSTKNDTQEISGVSEGRSDPRAIPHQEHTQKIKVFPQHVPMKPIIDPLSGGSLDAAKLAGTERSPDIGVRVIVKDASITCRFFDGFDWVSDAPVFSIQKEKPYDRKRELLGDLINGNAQPNSCPFKHIPLPEERNENLRRSSAQRKLSRNVHRYFQISIGGLKMRQDSFADSVEHQLASCLDLSMSDFFVAETISNRDPVKMIGEWINEREHPRDNSDGIVMLKMVTRHPLLRVSADGKLMSDESRATLELLPLRCYFDQRALRFMRNFFTGNSSAVDEDLQSQVDPDGTAPEDELMVVFFQVFKVRPCKLKVDYTPEKMDVDSFRDGNYVEILNLCPLEDMVLTLQAVTNHNLSGWGSVFRELAGRWVEDICATQAHKFITRATPVQVFTNLGDGVADLIIIPLEHTDYLKGILEGTVSFAEKFACEALTTSAKLTKFAANQLNTRALPSAGLASSLPSRPRSVPRHAGDAAGHAYESIVRGLREANYKIVTVPYREYKRNGASGAARSAVRGIPVAVLAPLSGASEALSYTLLGLRNQLRPDLRKEEEASLRGLSCDL